MADDSIHPFAAASNTQVLVTTALVSAMLLGMAVLFSVLAWKVRDRPPVRYALGAAAALQVVLLAASVTFRIRGYEIRSHQLVIRHGWSVATFPLDALLGARLQPQPFRGAIRCGGVGGVWSYLGRFSSPSLGDFRAYVSDPRRAVLITFTNEQVLVSPVDPDRFITILLKSK